MPDPIVMPDDALAPKVAAAVADLPKPALSGLDWLSKIDRKTWAGGVGSIVAWLLLAACSSWLHMDVAAYLQPIVNWVWINIVNVLATSPPGPPPSAQGGLAIGLGFLFSYALPPAWSDIYRRINSAIIARAVLDPDKKDVSVKQITAAVNVVKVDAANKVAAPF